jgi:hypothetical protein
MKNIAESRGETGWVCSQCNVSLEPGKAQIEYLGSVFTIDVLKCPKCSIVMISEETAVKKMAEAEQVLEDK